MDQAFNHRNNFDKCAELDRAADGSFNDVSDFTLLFKNAPGLLAQVFDGKLDFIIIRIHFRDDGLDYVADLAETIGIGHSFP